MSLTETSSFDTPPLTFAEENPRVRFRDILAALSKDLGIDDALRDYLLRRTRNEGIKFLTQKLPELSSAILASLEHGGFKYLLAHPIRCSFRLTGRSPLRVLIDGLYGHDGSPSCNELATWSLNAILQICEYFKKLELPNESEINFKGAVGFLKKNHEMGTIPGLTFTEKLLARHIWERIFPHQSADSYEYYREYKIGDGPGTYSAELPLWNSDGTRVPCAALKRGKKNNDFPIRHKKYKKFILDSFPEGACFTHHSREYSELLLVPKNTKSVRAIVREPKSNLRLQKPYFSFKADKLRQQSNGRFDLRSQDYNRERCRIGSITRQLSTLDFSEASNSILYRDIRNVRSNDPAFTQLLDNCRTKEVFVPSNYYDQLDRRNGMHICNTQEPSLVGLSEKGFTYDGIVVPKLNNLLIAQSAYLGYIDLPDVGGFNGYSRSYIERSLRIRALSDELKFYEANCSNSRKVIYNNKLGCVYTLHMLSGMGSYLTFCTMMEWFAVLYIMSAVRQRFGTFSIINVNRLRKLLNRFIDERFDELSLYGDDFISPNEYIDSFITYAASRGAKVNVAKSFRFSHFRESCGPYYYNGVEVTPIRLSLSAEVCGDSLVPHNNLDGFAVKLFAQIDRCEQAGLLNLAKVYRKVFRRTMGFPVSGISATSNGSGYLLDFTPERVDYYRITSSDRYDVYQAGKNLYELTSYGTHLFENSMGLTREEFVNLHKSNPLVCTYQLLPNPAIPNSGTLSLHKGDTYCIPILLGSDRAKGWMAYATYVAFWQAFCAGKAK
jgi:hypothetical protein